MLFCHFAKSTSVRDISNGLRSATGNLNHLGIKTAPSKSLLATRMENEMQICLKDVYFKLLGQLGQHTKERRIKLKIKVPVYLLDSTLISLMPVFVRLGNISN